MTRDRRATRLVLVVLALALLSGCATARVVNDADTDGDSDADLDGDAESAPDAEGVVEATACTTEDALEVCGERPCVDGFCCDDPCEGPCLACDIPGAEGSCTYVPEGTDLHEECTATSAASCGTTGECDGHGSCAFFGLETPCDDGEPCTTGDACSGEGRCAGVSPVGCEPGQANQCCEVSCESGGCTTRAGLCVERCTEYQLVVGQLCQGCGAPGAVGLCTAGEAHSCNESRHTLCEEVRCGGETYLCTNFEGEWAWRTEQGCDDGDDCTFGDACLDGECVATAYSCTDDPCMARSCDGEGSCVETPLPSSTACGVTSCPPDSCADDVWASYPAECTSTCDGAGLCEPCLCEAEETTCVAGGANLCCEVSCSDAGGCSTIPGSCGAEDTCGDSTLTIASACLGCGAPGANGFCGGAVALECSLADHTPCLAASCGGETYYCTNFGGTWRWRAGSPACDDGNLCTHGDACGAGGCQGTPITCTGGDCILRSCNGSAACTEVPLTGVVCEDGDPCTFGETCTAAGTCPSGAPITCADSDCVDRECDGTASCAETILTGSDCDDGDPCTFGDSCNAAGACAPGTPLDCDGSDWLCMDYSCNGTSSCTETPINPGATCDDGDPDTDFDECQPDGSCAGDPGCPPPPASCHNGSQNREGCGGARIIGRTEASGGYARVDSTCYAGWDSDFSGCWDGGSDHTYRVYLRTGETLFVRLEAGDSCSWYDSWYWDATLRIRHNSGCDDLSCSSEIWCDDFQDDVSYTHVAGHDGWVFIVVDGTTAFDDEGDYTLTLQLTCNRPGCEC